MALAALDVNLHVERGLECAVTHALCCHGQAAHSLVVKQLAMPSKHGIALQLQVGHHIAVGVYVMVTASCHLLLALPEQFQNSSVGRELGVDRKRLDGHAHGAG